MDQAQVLEAINKFVLSKYIENMITAKTCLLTLYTVFPYSGAANISDPVKFIMIEDQKSVISFIGANYNN